MHVVVPTLILSNLSGSHNLCTFTFQTKMNAFSTLMDVLTFALTLLDPISAVVGVDTE